VAQSCSVVLHRGRPRRVVRVERSPGPAPWAGVDGDHSASYVDAILWASQARTAPKSQPEMVAPVFRTVFAYSSSEEMARRYDQVAGSKWDQVAHHLAQCSFTGSQVFVL
jgi:hypothetical protein